MINNDYLEYDIKEIEKKIEKLVISSAKNRQKIKTYKKQLRKLKIKKEGEEDGTNKTSTGQLD